MRRFDKVEIDHDLGILEVTDINGRQLRYLMEPNGNLTLGRPWLQIYGDYRVKFFVPVGQDMPIILKIEDLSKST